MYGSNVKTRYRRIRKLRFCQGDIIRDLELVIGTADYSKHTAIQIPYAVIMSQDCDLDNDFKERKTTHPDNNDKCIKTILICPAYTAEQFFKGEHIDGWKMKPQNTSDEEKIKRNDQQKRYHYLIGETNFQIPSLVIDFKHFYTAPRDILYKKRKTLYLATLNELFREELSQRFANFISRIGLPSL